MATDKLENILDAIEIAEYPLLAWGICNGSLSHNDLISIIKATDSDADGASLIVELCQHGLIFVTPEGTYRSRIAEYLRLTTNLRQWMQGTTSDKASLLVHDIKFHLRQRSFPTRDVKKSEVFQSLVDEQISFDQDLLEKILPSELSRFQLRAVHSLLKSFEVSANKSIVVSAGTGSGKTNAYFLPMLTWLAGAVTKGGHLGPRALALYPRTELLKDQLSNAVKQVLILNGTLRELGRPTLRVGVWFGDVPQSIDYANNLKKWPRKKIDNDTYAWECSFLRCPKCELSPNVILTEINQRRKNAVLECPNVDCDFTIGEDVLVFTRNSQGIPSRRADITFTTTESLNRQLAGDRGDSAFNLQNGSALRTILVDEAHVYEGLPGAQTSYLFRRLQNRVVTPMTWVSLSATLENPGDFIEDLIGLTTEVIEPTESELEYRGAEYILAVRHYLESKKSPLSSAIQMAALMSRILDSSTSPTKSEGIFGRKLFVFGDKLDVVNRLFFFLTDAEGGDVKGVSRPSRTPKSLATLRSNSQPGQSQANVEPALDRFDTGQWWKISEDLGHIFTAVGGKKVGRTSSQNRGVQRDADIVVATASLEVGYDDNSVGAVLQYKMPRSVAGFLQRKGRAGRTQKMRPLTTIVLSPFGADRAAWTNAETRLFLPKLPARRLPLSNRYTQKMQGVYALLDWLHFKAGVSDSWNVLSGGNWKLTEDGRDNRPKLRENSRKIQTELNSLISIKANEDEFSLYLSNALSLQEHEVKEVMWGHPRGLMTVVIPTILRRLEDEFREDGMNSSDPLSEFISPNLFSELHTPEVEVEGLASVSDNENGDTTLPIQFVLREFIPGNSSRHFGFKGDDRHWVKVVPQQNVVDVVHSYHAENTGLFVEIEGNKVPVHRPRIVNLEQVPAEYGDGTTSYPEWGTSLVGKGEPTSILTRIVCWNSQPLELDFYLHSKGTNVQALRFVNRSRGWITTIRGTEERVDVGFECAGAKVVLGFDVDVDGVCIDLQRPNERSKVTSTERYERLEYLITHESELVGIGNGFDLERLSRSLVYLLVEHKDIDVVMGWNDARFQQELVAAAQAVVLDASAGMSSDSLKWFGQEHSPIIRRILRNVLGERDLSWCLWFDKRLATALGALVLDTFGEFVPDLDTDDLIIDIQIPDQDQSESIQIWITEASPGGNGSIERIVEELDSVVEFSSRLNDLLQPRELERLDSELRALALFALDSGKVEADLVRASWGQGRHATGPAIIAFKDSLRKSQIFPLQSSLAVFINRFLGPGSDPQLLNFLLILCKKWDQDESQIGFEISHDIAALTWQNDSSIDSALHLSNPTPGRRTAAVSGIAWTRADRGVQLDYEVPNQFSFGMTFDIPALRSLITTDPVNSGRLGEGQPVSSIETDIEQVELNPNIGAVEFVGHADWIRQLIIRAAVEKVEDDALWIHRTATKVAQSGDKLIVRLSSDLESL